MVSKLYQGFKFIIYISIHLFIMFTVLSGISKLYTIKLHYLKLKTYFQSR